MKNATIFFALAAFSSVACTKRPVDSTGKSTSISKVDDSIVLVAASDGGITVAVFEEKGKLIENGDYFCAARSDGMGGVYGTIHLDSKLPCFRNKDALLKDYEHGQRLECTRAANTHEGYVTHCNVWERFNRAGFIDARLELFRGDTCRAVFKAKPHTEKMYCSVLFSEPGGVVIASYGCYPSLDASQKNGREPSERLKRVEVQCTPDQSYNPDRMYAKADCKVNFIP